MGALAGREALPGSLMGAAWAACWERHSALGGDKRPPQTAGMLGACQVRCVNVRVCVSEYVCVQECKCVQGSVLSFCAPLRSAEIRLTALVCLRRSRTWSGFGGTEGRGYFLPDDLSKGV